MTFSTIESSRDSREPVNLYLFEGSASSPESLLQGFAAGTIGPYAFNDGEANIVRNGITYIPWPIKPVAIKISITLDGSDVKIEMARGSALDNLFIAYPPSQVINVTLFQGNIGDTPTVANFPAQWAGRVRSPKFTDTTLELTADPVSTSLRRPGLRRNYQIGCPLVLYGGQCLASRAAATINRTIQTITGSQVDLTATLDSGLPTGYTGATTYPGGTVTWTRPDGIKEIRTITSVLNAGYSIKLRGILNGLAVTDSIEISRGCRRTMADCSSLHSNILNYGGQPWIPNDNPISNKSQFY